MLHVYTIPNFFNAATCMWREKIIKLYLINQAWAITFVTNTLHLFMVLYKPLQGSSGTGICMYLVLVYIFYYPFLIEI